MKVTDVFGLFFFFFFKIWLCSLVVKRQSCKLEIEGSIPSRALYFFLYISFFFFFFICPVRMLLQDVKTVRDVIALLLLIGPSNNVLKIMNHNHVFDFATKLKRWVGLNGMKQAKNKFMLDLPSSAKPQWFVD